jgi:hypothetical protein
MSSTSENGMRTGRGSSSNPAGAVKAVGGGDVTKVEHFNAGRVRWEIDVRRNGRSWEVKLSRTLRVLSKDLRHGGGGDDGPNHH